MAHQGQASRAPGCSPQPLREEKAGQEETQVLSLFCIDIKEQKLKGNSKQRGGEARLRLLREDQWP